MPLLDHFHPPLSERRPWESFQTTWASAIADVLNRDVLPAGYIALEELHAGPAIENDVASFREQPEGGAGGTATATRTVWKPATAPLVLPGQFPPTCTVEVLTTEGARTLVAAIELVSPANKDRPERRRLFAAKSASYLARGIGLVVVDVVTTRQANLHNELIELVGFDADFRMAAEGLYAVAYRPLRVGGVDQVESWLMPLSIGQPLPRVPLSLEAELCVPVDLETAYTEACQRRRLDEVVS